MTRYRCYFFRSHHIVAVEVIAAEGDASATAIADALLRDKLDCESFEVWEGGRQVQVSADVLQARNAG